MKGGFGFNHALRVRRAGENEVMRYMMDISAKVWGEFISSPEISRLFYNFDQGKK